ncbi:MAG: glycosyltransferase [Candidatus Kapaibacteriota bacterium]
MDKSNLDILFIALNKIQFDARLYNFINTFLSLNKTLGALTIDYPTLKISNLKHCKIQIEDNLRTITKTLKFYKQSLDHIGKFEPKFTICSDVYSLPVGVKFKKRYNSALIYDSREIYSSLASLKNHPLKQFLLKHFEAHYVEYVDKIIVTGELDKDFLLTKFPSKHITVIKNFPRRANQIKTFDIKNMLGIANDAIIAIYQGVLIGGRGVEISLRSLLYDNKIHLVIAGGGPLEDRFKSLAKEIAVDKRTHFIGSIPYSELINYTAACDIGLCLIEPISLSYELALPNKLFEYIQAKIPIVATKLTAIEKIFDQHDVGLLVQPNISARELAKVIRFVVENSDKYKQNLEKASGVFVWENQESKIKDLLQ